MLFRNKVAPGDSILPSIVAGGDTFVDPPYKNHPSAAEMMLKRS